MTPVMDALSEIAAGRVPAGDALLQNCRLEGFGTRTFGREPILDLFRRAPVDLSGTPDGLESPHAVMVVAGDTAIFADVHDGRFIRLWMLGDQALGAPEASVSVPRDLDLSQFEADVIFDPADHPQLDVAGAAAISRVVRSERMAALNPLAFSRRTFVIRAFSVAGRTAALVVCSGALDAIVRKPFSINVALLADTASDGGEAPRLVLDRAASVRCEDRAWTPRL